MIGTTYCNNIIFNLVANNVFMWFSLKNILKNSLQVKAFKIELWRKNKAWCYWQNWMGATSITSLFLPNTQHKVVLKDKINQKFEVELLTIQQKFPRGTLIKKVENMWVKI